MEFTAKIVAIGEDLMDFGVRGVVLEVESKQELMALAKVFGATLSLRLIKSVDMRRNSLLDAWGEDGQA